MTENQRTIAGRYQVKDLIGRGGMADVYEGVDTRLGRVVAIKILRADLAADSTFEARFRQEAQASARMAHPTIVRIYDAGEEHLIDGNGNAVRRPYIVMEYVRGALLRDLIHERQLEIREAVSFAEGVLTALEVSHRSGVIHRDIKSANIMITENGQVKVMDFGIARAVTDSSATQAHTGGIVGTAQYFSPEQAKGETVDSRTDLYSTGVLLYEMLTGRPPFRGETAVSVAYQHVSEPVTPPSKFNPNLSPELDSVVLRALAKDREERFQSAEQFREHLLAAFAVSRNFMPTANAKPAAETIAAQVAPPVAPTELFAQSFFEQDEETSDELVSDETSVAPAMPAAETEVFGFDDLINAAIAEANGDASPPQNFVTPASATPETPEHAAPSHASPSQGAPSQGAHEQATDVQASPAQALTDSNPYFYETKENPRVNRADNLKFGQANSGESNRNQPVASFGEQTNPFESIGIEFEAQVESDSRRERKALKASNSSSDFNPLAGGLVAGPKTRTKSILWGLISSFVVILLGLGVWSISTIGSIHVTVPTSASVSVPDVSGKTYDDAYAALKAANLLVARTYQPSDTIALNSVISIDPPAGTSVSPHTTVTVYVSGGKTQVKVPNLANTLETEANTALTAAGLTLGQITQQNSADAPKGTIIATNPVQFTQVPKGTPIDLVVSTGKVTVPNVIQQSVTTAKSLLSGSDIGFSVSVQSSTPGCTGTLGQIVTGQSIAAGDAAQHQKITIFVDCIGGVVPTPSASATPSPTL